MEEDRFEVSGATLPADALAAAYRVTEAVSRPFELVVEIATSDPGFDAEACLKSQISLVVSRGLVPQRVFDGVVQEVRFRRAQADRLYFMLRAGPALSALGYRRGSRIFQDLSVVDVVNTLFDEAGFLDRVQKQLERTYAPKPYIVQYRETELHFVERLLEDAGIFYFFEHDDQGHRLILADTPSAFRAQGAEPLLSLATNSSMFAEPLLRFQRRRRLATTNVLVRDFDFEKPGTAPEGQQSAKDGQLSSFYEYPGGFTAGDAGATTAKVRLGELRAGSDVVQGSTRSMLMRCGAPFAVEGAGDDALNGRFVVTELVTSGDVLAEDPNAREAHRVTFRAIPEGAPFSPPRRTPKPRIRGLQTAVVTGAETSDQAIHTDQYGRIKVRFYWDRIGQQDHTSSCWMRVSQIPMGGAMILPRVGWEVSVAFLGGDPDRPVVLGRLYDGTNAAPQGLPAAKASGSFKSMSSPGGAGVNEIGFGDSGGSQGFGIKAQKDLNVTCGNDTTEKIGVDDAHTVGVNMNRSVKTNETVTVGGNATLSVGANLSSKVQSSQSVTVAGNDESNATGNFLEKESSRNYTVGGNQLTISNGIVLSATGAFTRSVGAVEVRASVQSISDNVLAASSSTVGAVRVHLVNGSHGEVVGGAKSQTSAAAEVHVTSGAYQCSAGAAHANLVGGLHWRKIDGDLVVKAPMISLIGGIGKLQAGSTSVTLAGGPITLKGGKIVIKAAMIKKTGATMKKA